MQMTDVPSLGGHYAKENPLPNEEGSCAQPLLTDVGESKCSNNETRRYVFQGKRKTQHCV